MGWFRDLLTTPRQKEDALKRRARELWIDIDRMEAEANCGRGLLRDISPRYGEAEREFVETMQALADGGDEWAKRLLDTDPRIIGMKMANLK